MRVPIVKLIAFIFWLFRWCLIGFTLLATPAYANIDAAKRSVPRIITIASDGYGGVRSIATGTGFAIAPDVIVTNLHVIRPAMTSIDGQTTITGKIFIVGPTGEASQLEAQVINWGRTADIAILRVPGANFIPLPLTKAGVDEESRVAALGYPGILDRMFNANEAQPATPETTIGNVSSYRNLGPDPAIVHTARISEGNSGGPLLDECGRVIGVNTAIDTQRGNVGMALGAQIVIDLANAGGVTTRVMDTTCVSATEAARQQTIEDQGRAARAERERTETAKRQEDEFARKQAQSEANLAKQAAELTKQAAETKRQMDTMQATNNGIIGFGVLAIIGLGIGFFVMSKRNNSPQAQHAHRDDFGGNNQSRAVGLTSGQAGALAAIVLLVGLGAGWVLSNQGKTKEAAPPNPVPNDGAQSTTAPSWDGASVPSSSVSPPPSEAFPVSNSIVRSNLNTADEPLMRNRAIGTALNCDLDTSISITGTLQKPPPQLVDFRIKETDGCFMGRTQYAKINGRFERTSLEEGTRNAILTTLDPANSRYRRVYVPLSADEYTDVEAIRDELRGSKACSPKQATNEADLINETRDLFTNPATVDVIWTCRVTKDGA